MVNVLSIDPGITTGIATRVHGKYSTFEVINYEGVFDIVQDHPWDLVLCENFTAKHISKYGLATVRIIGGVAAICYLRKIPMKTQQNFERIRYKPKAIELMGGNKGPRDHKMDALAHLLCWEANNEHS